MLVKACEHLIFISDVYDRQDSLGLDNLTLPVLATAFLAAFLASLIGSTLAGNLSHMLSLDFAAPAPLQVKALPAVPLGKILLSCHAHLITFPLPIVTIQVHVQDESPSPKSKVQVKSPSLNSEL